MKIGLCNLNSNQKGVTLFEFSLVIPIFLAAVVGLLYLGISLGVQGVLDHAASRALAAAVIMPELSDERVACVQNSSASYCTGLDQVRQAARDVLQSSFMIRSDGSTSGIASMTLSDTNPKVTIPEPTAGESAQQAFERAPITIEIKAQVNSFFPMPGLPPIVYTGRASGFYEVRSALSYPVPVDCNGNPKNSAAYMTQPCDCSSIPNSVWNSNTGSCEACSPDRLNHLDANHNVYMPTVSACACPSEEYCQAQYGPGAQLWWAGPDACKCGCNFAGGGWQFGRLSGGPATSCTCGSPPSDYPPGNPNAFHFNGQQVNGQICECVPSLTQAACDAIFPDEIVRVANPAHCNCECATECTGTYRHEDGTRTNSNTQNFWDPSQGCECHCYNPDWTYDPNRTYTGAGCACTNTCPAGKHPNEAAADCACTCNVANMACPGGANGIAGFYDVDACACRCHAGTYPNCLPAGNGG